MASSLRCKNVIAVVVFGLGSWLRGAPAFSVEPAIGEAEGRSSLEAEAIQTEAVQTEAIALGAAAAVGRAIAQRLPQTAAQSDPCLPQSAPASDGLELPQDYIDNYATALTQPSPQAYYAFAQTLLDYGEHENARLWLDRTATCFPETLAANQLYRAVAFAQADRLDEAMTALDGASQLEDSPIYAEVAGYLLTLQGDWEPAIALLRTSDSPVNVNNYLIAQYCTMPPKLERKKSSVPNTPCPFGNILRDVREPSKEGRQVLDEMVAKIDGDEVENLYLLNTLGFLALQSEDYDSAYTYYTQLQEEVERNSFAAPDIVGLRNSAAAYAGNYEQNAAFLQEKQQSLAVLRSQRQNLLAVTAVAGTANLASRIARSRSTGSIVTSGLLTLGSALGLSSEARQLKRERRELLDSIRQNFLRDMTLLAARPNLDPDRLLPEIDQQPYITPY